MDAKLVPWLGISGQHQHAVTCIRGLWCSTKAFPTFKNIAPWLSQSDGWVLPFLQPYIATRMQLRFWHPLTWRHKPWLPVECWLNFCFARPWVLNAIFSSVSASQAHKPVTSVVAWLAQCFLMRFACPAALSGDRREGTLCCCSCC